MRAASGPRIGLGHAARTLAVAQEVAALGASPTVVVDEDGTAAFLERAGVPATTVEAARDWTALPADHAWFDGFADASEELGRLAARGVPVVLVENRTRAREHASVLVYPSLHHVDDDWDRANSARVRSGADWIPLRRAVLDARGATRDVDLLITFGGADPFELSERVLRLLPAWLPDEGARVVVAVGPHMGDRASALERLARGRAELVRPDAALPRWMARSRRALTAVATTLNELAFLGVRALLLANYADDREVLDHHARRGPHVPVGVAPELADDELVARLAAAWETCPATPAKVPGLGEGARALAELLLQTPARS